MSRHARESLNPALYLNSTYYQIWLEGLIKLMTNAGLVTAEEVISGRMSEAPRPVKRVLPAAAVERALAAEAPTGACTSGWAPRPWSGSSP